MLEEKKKEKHLLYGTCTIIYSLVGLALFTEKGPFSTTVSMNMQMCLRVIQVIFKWLYKCQEAERNIGPEQIHIWDTILFQLFSGEID